MTLPRKFFHHLLVRSLLIISPREVRRAALLNIPINTPTIPHILDRTRDTDATVRKLVYTAVLEPNVQQGETTNMGPAHPRALTIAQRELIVRSGLGDREQSVRTAAASLLGTWVDVLADSNTEQADTKFESGVVALLKIFDLVESTVAVDALLSVFVTRSDIFDSMMFGGMFDVTTLNDPDRLTDSYWTSLTPETAFLARVFVDHCKATKNDDRLDTALPVVTALAFRIQEAYNDLLEDMQNEEEERVIRDLSEEEEIILEDIQMDKEFVIGEMLKLAVNLDYADEIGRRKMFSLVREFLAVLF
jgi:condensin complex subunit 3